MIQLCVTVNNYNIHTWIMAVQAPIIFYLDLILDKDKARFSNGAAYVTHPFTVRAEQRLIRNQQ